MSQPLGVTGPQAAVDDEELVRSGLRTVLEAAGGFEVVGEAGVAAAHGLRPDVVLVDIRMPVLAGLAATRRILALPARWRAEAVPRERPSCSAGAARRPAPGVPPRPAPAAAGGTPEQTVAWRTWQQAAAHDDGRAPDHLRRAIRMPKTWFITGASRGFGREWTIAALERGDTVAATARDTGTLADLVDRFGDAVLPIRLDVDDRDAVFAAVQQAHDRFDALDVVVNNAGYGQFGMVEEISEAEARAQFDTNVFGALFVTQAALPLLRAQRSGHILQVSSIGGVSAFPNIGIYNASKWALEAFSQSLAAEVADFGIKVTIIEPGAYATDWGGASARHATPNPAYDEFREKAADQRRARAGNPGDPVATREAVLQLVDAENPPLRVFFGDGPLAIATWDYESRLAEWRAWESLSTAAHGTRG